jgi:hypothetical protein
MTRHRRAGTSPRRLLAAAAVLVVLALTVPADAQCAMCRRALQSPEGRQMIAAFRGGILVLLAAPFAVFGTVATLAVRRFRRKPDANGLTL